MSGTPSPSPFCENQRNGLIPEALLGVRRPKCGDLKDLRPKDVQRKDLETERATVETVALMPHFQNSKMQRYKWQIVDPRAAQQLRFGNG